MPGSVDERVWEDLRKQARQAMRRAYAPYSGYPVGVAALVDDGRVITGCNVENASYGLGLCAECGLVSQLAATGGGKLVAFSCSDGQGSKLVPCGRCRQLLYEFGGPDLLLDMPSGIQPLSTVLPEAFGPDHLKQQTTQPQP
ncbi:MULTISPECIES: cytidine deaminase [unclassified Brevibacterium]|uniref:cytidine deaminase n=1 Tax=unclassified Brevibacterium TaxID=2614124 RepID=UPI0008A18ED9|nr:MULTISPECIES: cytidine deaminase [unclassified Brevibacterium]OFL68974.1 cytidine deaminase [Brevibacterium sp. HMSC063G07]OFS26914.1 cytidine deaminase [Brevibacterium sp. HMSC07C04]